MDKLLGAIVHISDSGSCDTFCDRLNCVYTVFLLAIFAFLTTTKNYVGDQVSCWCPSHFTGSHRDYANQVSLAGTVLRITGQLRM